ASRGETKVTDVFGEVEIPLARDLPWAYSLNVNAAVRGTHYSNSGNVTTWKVGAVYEPVADVRFRTTVSRDIRAPSLTDLFAAGQTVSGTTVFDPVNNVSLNNSFSLSAGNPKLEPEKA